VLTGQFQIEAVPSLPTTKPFFFLLTRPAQPWSPRPLATTLCDLIPRDENRLHDVLPRYASVAPTDKAIADETIQKSVAAEVMRLALLYCEGHTEPGGRAFGPRMPVDSSRGPTGLRIRIVSSPPEDMP
jgi:hypothetical protein